MRWARMGSAYMCTLGAAKEARRDTHSVWYREWERESGRKLIFLAGKKEEVVFFLHLVDGPMSHVMRPSRTRAPVVWVQGQGPIQPGTVSR